MTPLDSSLALNAKKTPYTLESHNTESDFYSPFDEENKLALITQELDLRRENLGYGLGIFLGRFLGLRDSPVIPNELPLADKFPIMPQKSLLHKIADSYKYIKHIFGFSDGEAETKIDIDRLCAEISMQDYVIYDPIAIGGKGTLFRAFDLRTDETVALKIDHAPVEEQTMEKAAETQRDTTREVMALHHFNRLRGCGKHSDANHNHYNFVASMLIDGIDLSKHLSTMQDNIRATRNIDDLKIQFNELIEIAYHICSEVLQFHNEGFIHRDIKLENLLIDITDEKMHVKLVDFGGMVKDLDIEDDIDNQFGTLLYLAPELAHSKPSHLSDTYSVGKCLERITQILDIGGFSKLKRKSQFYDNAYHALSDITLKLSAHEPSERLSLADAKAELAALINIKPKHDIMESKNSKQQLKQ